MRTITSPKIFARIQPNELPALLAGVWSEVSGQKSVVSEDDNFTITRYTGKPAGFRRQHHQRTDPADKVLRPGEMQFKDWVGRQVAITKARRGCILKRFYAGHYPNIVVRQMNERLKYVREVGL